MRVGSSSISSQVTDNSTSKTTNQSTLSKSNVKEPSSLSSSSTTKRDSKDLLEFAYNEETDNEFSFDYDDYESTPTKAIVWRDSSSSSAISSSSGLKSTRQIHDDDIEDVEDSSSNSSGDYGSYHNANANVIHAADTQSKKTNNETSSNQFTTPLSKTKSILKEKNNHHQNNTTTCTPSKQRIQVTPSLSSSSSSKKKSARVSFDNNVNFKPNKKATPVKAKRVITSSKKIKTHNTSSAHRSKTSSRTSTKNTTKTIPSKQTSKNHSVTVSNEIESHEDCTALTNKSDHNPPLMQNVTTTTSVAASLHNPRGLAIDTRALETFTGDAIARTYQTHVISFLQTAFGRGLAPTILTTMKYKEDKKTKNNRATNGSKSNQMNGMRNIEVSSTYIGKDIEKEAFEDHLNRHRDSNSIIPLIHIKPPSNVGNVKNRNAVHVPKKLMACDSWRLVGDLG